MSHPYLTRRAQEDLEREFQLEREMMDLFGLIVTEFETDPLSVQCFDLRTVERSKAVFKELSKLKRNRGAV